MAPGKTDAAHRPALHDDRRLAERAHGLERASGSSAPPAIINSSSVPTMRSQSGRIVLQARRDLARLDVALLAGAVAGKAPEVRAVVDVEHDLAAVRLGEVDRQLLRRRGVLAGEMRAGDDDRLALATIGLVDVALVERAVGAIVAIENQRERLVVADAEHHERGQPLRIGVDARDVDALARALLADVAAHMLVADPRDEAALQARAAPCRWRYWSGSRRPPWKSSPCPRAGRRPARRRGRPTSGRW